MNTKLFEIALSLAPRVGDFYAKQLISYLGSAEEVIKTPKAKLLKIPGVGHKIAEGISNKSLLITAENIIKQCDNNQVKILHFTDDAYPVRLKQIDDSPSLLYTKGDLDLNFKRSVAIVGTREATNYGKEVTEELVNELLALEDCVVVSGLAYGIDITAHKQCLKTNLPTVGVMANGIDSVYPSDHKSIAHRMLECGALITENPPGSKPDAPKFPARNRIIAGMTDLTIVIEGAKKGGALITAEIANSYHKEVFAVPGKINSKASQGCNNLIKQHKAHIYTCFDDMTSIMNWGKFEPKKPKSKPQNLSPIQSQVYDFMQKVDRRCSIDEISRLTQVSVLELLPVLLDMEFSNIIRSLQGNEYEIK